MLDFFSQKKNTAESEADFIRQYLEQDRQSSNIYFHLAQRERVQKKQRNSVREMMVRRFFLLFSSAAAVFIIVVAVSVYQYGTGSSAGLFSEASYKDILSGYAALKDFRFQKAALAFRQAGRESSAQAPRPVLSSLALAFSNSFSSAESLPADISETLFGAAKMFAHAWQSLATVSPDALFASGGAAQSAGAVFAQAEQEMQGAGKMLEDVTKPGLWRQTTGEEQKQINAAFADIPAIQEHQAAFSPIVHLLARVFDPHQTKKFLVFLQNQNIPRSSGGFIDAYGVITIAGGAVAGISFDDVNNLDGQLAAKIIPPVQLQNSTTSWGMRDANWFLDFPTTAGKAASFYRKSGGDRVDGVIVMDEELLADTLRITGPVSVSSGQVDADGLLAALHAHMRAKEKTMPVSVLNETIPLLFKKIALLSEDDLSSVAHMFTDALSRKNAMVWFADEELQGISAQERWDGAVAHADGANYMALSAYDVDEDIQPNPFTQDILVQTDVAQDGSIMNTVAVQLQRRGDDVAQAGDDSLYYVKLYVPKGSQLIAASGTAEQSVIPQIDYQSEHFMPDEDVYASEATLQTDHANKTEVFEESGKTVFGTYVTPGVKGAKLLYHYKLPFALGDTKDGFTSLFQKQPGSHGTLQFSLMLPDGKHYAVSDTHPFNGEFSGAFSHDLTLSAQIK